MTNSADVAGAESGWAEIPREPCEPTRPIFVPGGTKIGIQKILVHGEPPVPKGTAPGPCTGTPTSVGMNSGRFERVPRWMFRVEC